MKNLKILLILTCVLLFSFVSSYNLEKESINNIAIHGYDKPAEFLFKFTNAKDGYYEIFTFVDVNLLPEEKFLIENGTKELSVKVYPTEKIGNIKGLYSFIFYVKDPEGKVSEERLRINLKEITDLFEVYSDANFLSEEVSFYLENKENISLKGIKAKFSSILFEEEKTFDIKPLEKKEFFIKVDKEKMKKIPAGSYLLETTFISPEGKKYTKEGKIIFGEKKEIFNSYKKEGYLIIEETLVKKNLGNVVENVQFSVERSLFSSLIISFNEKPDKIEREGFKKVYIWNKKINPSEGVEIKMKTNLLIPLVSLFLIVGLIIVLRKYYSKDLTIKKSVQFVKTKGGEFAVRVKIYLKANKDIKNVSLNEKIPSFLKLYKKFGATPPNIINEKRGNLVWNVGDLASGEERMFSYILYSKVWAYGKIVFPETVGVYEKGTKIFETFSNKVFFLSEQRKFEKD